MKVYSLVGKSGTGKSFQSMNLCHNLEIDAIIDDGLLIYKNNVIAGKSAKRAETKIGAVKTALFNDDDHAERVKKAIKEMNLEKLLIIGTSDKMVEKIRERLDVPEVFRTIYIEDITTEEDRKVAYRQREVLGKHVIPASTFQIKRDFAGYFVNPLQIFRDVADKALEMAPSDERTVVRPTYSYLGRYFISDKVIEDIINCIAAEKKKELTLLKITENSKPDSMIINLVIRCRANGKLIETATMLQKEIKEMIEKMTAFNIAEVNVEIREVVLMDHDDKGKQRKE